MEQEHLIRPEPTATRRRHVLAGILACLLTLAAGGGTASAEEPETWQVIGTLVAYDSASQTLAVRGPSAARVYRIRRSGPMATQVSWNAQPARLDQIPRGAPVALRWRRDASGGRVARLIEGPWAAEPEPVSN